MLSNMKKALTFDLYINNSPRPILTVKVTVMHIMTANILEIVKYMTSITTVINYEVTYGLYIVTIAFELDIF